MKLRLAVVVFRVNFKVFADVVYDVIFVLLFYLSFVVFLVVVRVKILEGSMNDTLRGDALDERMARKLLQVVQRFLIVEVDDIEVTGVIARRV